MTISFDNALNVHPQALALRSARAEMLAGNIANADTPNFKARDIDFQQALNAATSGGRDVRQWQTGSSSSGGLRLTHSDHLKTDTGPADHSQWADAVRYRTPSATAVDDNTVDVQREQAEIARNNIQLQAALRFVDSRFKGLNTALKGE